MDIGNRVVNVEVFLKVESVDKLPRVLIQHEPGNDRSGLHLGTPRASLKYRNVLKPSHGASEESSFLDVLIDRDELESFIEVKLLKVRPCCAKILGVIHPVVFLILIAVQIRDGPLCFVIHGALIHICVVLLEFLTQVLPLDINLQI